MTKSGKKKNGKLRRRIQRTIAAVTMITAVVVAAIPVENLGTVQADNSRALLPDMTSEIDAETAHYEKNNYENAYSGGTAIVQRIIESGGGGSFIDVFEVKKQSSGNVAMIINDIIGDGFHGSETELTINSTEYCDYVQFDEAFIGDVEKGLNDSSGAAKQFAVTFGNTPQSFNVPSTAPSGSGLSNIQFNTIDTASLTDTSVAVPITINTNTNAQGYTNFSSLTNLSSKTMYEQSFGQRIYNERISAINAYNQNATSLAANITNFITRVTATNYTWQGSDTTEWNNYVNQANTLNNRYNSLQSLSTPWTDFDKADNGLDSIVDYIIRNYCKNGTTGLVNFRLKGLTKRIAGTGGKSESVYVPQYTGQGNYTGMLDTKQYLASTSVEIRGIASSDTTNKAFKKTLLNTIVLPSGLQFIGEGAFSESNLTSVTVNAGACEIIGKEAFAGCTRLATINFTFGGGDGSNRFMTIDNKAFYGAAITSVKIPYSVKTVGAGAFANATSLTEVIFDDTGRGSDIDIEKGAFYDCTALAKVEFPQNNTRQYKIQKGAFAIVNPGGALTDFKFPGGNVDINYGNNADDYDYILANRNTLKTVTFPGGLKTLVPDNTLAGCNNLSYVVFPEGAKKAGYTPDKLFADVWGDPGFYVEGPEILDTPTSKSTPRETTWKAKAGLTKTNPDVWALTSVPYKFTDSNGKVHFEIGTGHETDQDGNPIGPPKYIANIEVIDNNNKLASLVSYFPAPTSGTPTKPEKVWLTIPTKVGEYSVVSIEQGCFDDAKDLKDNVTQLTIGDSVKDIKAGAFKEMKALQWVDIGSAVTNIESEAFAGCEKLENVVFSQAITSTLSEDDVEYWQELKIADDAFKTNSKRLTFHGAVNPNYAPFKIAMSANNSDLLKTENQICYKTDAPLNLTIIRNRNDGKATLINYPHYEDIKVENQDIVNIFEKVYITGQSITEEEREKLNSDAGKAIIQTLKMELPSGIESIDSKSFFDTKNEVDYSYFTQEYKKTAATENSKTQSEYETIDVTVNIGQIQKVDNLMKSYSIDGAAHPETYHKDERYAEVIGDTAYKNDNPDSSIIVSTGGLFSGGFHEATITGTDPAESVIWSNPYEGHTYKEVYTSGNDYLTSINMRGVKELPQYAFDSCENLLTVTFNAVEKMGNLPFRGCKNLYNINTGDSKFAFENLLLYEKKDDGSTELIQCLEGRGQRSDNGQNYYTNAVTSERDPMLATVSSIRKGAFSNCTEIATINLEDSKIRNIPERAFENCENLFQVTLPKTVSTIGPKAFNGIKVRQLYLTIENPNCQIAKDAFDFKHTNSVTIYGIEKLENGDPSTTYESYEIIKKELEESGLGGDQIHFEEPKDLMYILTFQDELGNIIEALPVGKGETLRNPPTAPNKTGYRFDYWICTDARDENGATITLTGEATYSNVTGNRTIRPIYVIDNSSIVPDGNDHKLTVVNGKAMIGGNMVTTFPTDVKGGTSVTIMSNDETNFKVWTTNPTTYISLLANPNSSATSFPMPNADLVVTANTAISGGDTPNPDGTYTVTVNNGTGGGNYLAGATVTITANAAPTGQTFTNWTTATSGVSFANQNSASTTFVMPASNVTVTANYSGGNNPDDPNNPDQNKKYKLTVNYGTGSGEYTAGTTVTITANAPESSSRVFSRWTTSSSGVTFANANAATTTIVMPSSDTVVTANYKLRSDDDDDDDDDDSSSNRRPGNNSSTNVVDRPNNSTNTTTPGTTDNNTPGTSNGTTSTDNGNRIYITKNGVSNKDIASISVDGSTDNFIVKITESEEATAAVEEALINKYGSLDGLAYFPMDISLYDATGQNKITDTYGLNITVTMPIPDVLIQYGGNNRVAAADNGNLQQLTPRFTTIDGIACISFVPPHFSPYVIYVDTNNLTAGQTLDSTPKTGDPIHPKWFAVIGMACLSVVLFVTSDGRKRRNYKTV